MKKISFLVFFSFIALSTIKAQKNVIKINPISTILGAITIGYEHTLSKKSGLEANVSFINRSFSASNSSVKVNGYGVEGACRIYFSADKIAPRGWYAAPGIGYSSIEIDHNGNNSSASGIGFGAVAGHQWVFGESETGFALDLNLGFQYNSLSTSGATINNKNVAASGIAPKLGVSIGYAF